MTVARLAVSGHTVRMMQSRLLMWGLLLAMVSVSLGCQTTPNSPYEQYLAEKERNDAAVAQIQSLGGRVHRTDPGTAVLIANTDERETGQAIELLDDIMLLDSLRLTEAQLSPGNLRPLEGLYLRHLTVSRTTLTERTLPALFGLTGLRSLHLIDTNAGDAAIAHLAGFDDLETLTFAYEPLTDAGVAELAMFPRLRTLRLVETEVSEEVLRDLVAINTRLVVELGDDRIIRGVDATR
ncbi:MAG: hypothetical protein WD079_04450 [Phycisphaeraceae bacterium]